MILSMLLLITFVSYWLNSQYQNESKKLEEEIVVSFHSVSADVQRRLIYKKHIRPILQHYKTAGRVQFQIDGVELTSDRKDSIAYFFNLQYEENKKKYDSLFYYYEHDEFRPDILRETSDLLYEFRKIAYDIDNDFGSRFFITYPYIPEQQFQADLNFFFQKLVQQKYPRLEIIWKTPDSSWDEEKNIIISYYDRESKEHIPYAKVEKQRKHILVVILPQIIFVIILLGFSAFALIFAYHSYIAQIRLNLIRGDFVNNITHELKIPVATAKVALEALQQFGIKKDIHKTEEYLKMVSTEMNRLDSLTTRVLEHSRLKTHKQLLHKKETNLNKFIAGVVNSMQLVFNTDKIESSLPPETIHLTIDPVYMEGVIRNLIENSMKYGGKNVKVIVHLQQERSKVYISVTDNGPGIPKEYVSKIFEQFFRVPTGNTHNTKGFGLGLSFASLVVKQHNGTIGAKNLSHGGCEIKITLPIV